MVERPPKHNGAFHRPLKLMAVYNLRNQQAVTCNTGHERTCVLCVCLIPTYIAKTLLFLAILAFFLPWFFVSSSCYTRTHAYVRLDHPPTFTWTPIFPTGSPSLFPPSFFTIQVQLIVQAPSSSNHPVLRFTVTREVTREGEISKSSCFSLFLFTRNDIRLVTIEI